VRSISIFTENTSTNRYATRGPEFLAAFSRPSIFSRLFSSPRRWRVSFIP